MNMHDHRFAYPTGSCARHCGQLLKRYQNGVSRALGVAYRPFGPFAHRAGLPHRVLGRQVLHLPHVVLPFVRKTCQMDCGSRAKLIRNCSRRYDDEHDSALQGWQMILKLFRNSLYPIFSNLRVSLCALCLELALR